MKETKVFEWVCKVLYAIGALSMLYTTYIWLLG